MPRAKNTTCPRSFSSIVSSQSLLTKTRQKNIRTVGNLMADLMESDDCPLIVSEAIGDYLAELSSVANLMNPRILRAVYSLFVGEAQKCGVDTNQPNLVGQMIKANPADYASDANN